MLALHHCGAYCAFVFPLLSVHTGLVLLALPSRSMDASVIDMLTALPRRSLGAQTDFAIR